MKPTIVRGEGTAPPVGDVLPVVAQALGTSRRAAEMALRGPLSLARQCARVIAALKAAGADETLVQFIQPIDLAIHDAQPLAFSNDERQAGPPVAREIVSPAEVSTRETADAYLDQLYRKIQIGLPAQG